MPVCRSVQEGPGQSRQHGIYFCGGLAGWTAGRGLTNIIRLILRLLRSCETAVVRSAQVKIAKESRHVIWNHFRALEGLYALKLEA